MAGSVNKVILVGNVGKEPDVRETAEGKIIASFSLATTETWKDKESNRHDKTEWHNIVVFSDQLSNVVQTYIHKGSKLYIEGKLRTRKFTDKQNIERSTTEVLVDNLTMLDKKEDKDEERCPF